MIVQVYVLTIDSDDKEIEQMYEKIEKFIKSEKSNKHLIKMGDRTAVVGEMESCTVIGKYWYGRKNEGDNDFMSVLRRTSL